MNTTRNLVLGGVLRVIGLMANVVVGFYLMPFIVHGLGDRIFGYWTILATIIGYYGLLDLGIVSAVQYYVAKAIGQNNRIFANRVISTTFIAFAILGLCALLVTLIIAIYSRDIINDDIEAQMFRYVIVIMGLGFAIGFPCRVFVGVVSANLRFDLVSVLNIGCLILRAVGIIVLLNNGYGIIGLAVITTLTDVLNYTFFYVIARNIHADFDLSLKHAEYKVLKEVLGYSVFTFIIKISEQLRFCMHSLIITAYISVNAVTHYAIASQLSSYLQNLMIALLGLIAPYFSMLLGRNAHDDIKKVYLRSIKYSVTITTCIVLLLALYGRQFIELWMGVQYLDAFIPLLLLLMGSMFDVCQIPSTAYLYGVAKHRFLTYITLIEGLSNLGLSIYFVQIYGLAGVALGAAIPMFIIRFIFLPLYVCKNAKIDYTEYYLKYYLRNVVISGGSIIVPWYFLSLLITASNYINLAIILLIHGVIAAPIIVFLSFKEEKEYIFEAIFMRIKKYSFSIGK
jgi:O-antigen/teichoic acid export membrane protein